MEHRFSEFSEWLEKIQREGVNLSEFRAFLNQFSEIELSEKSWDFYVQKDKSAENALQSAFFEETLPESTEYTLPESTEYAIPESSEYQTLTDGSFLEFKILALKLLTEGRVSIEEMNQWVQKLFPKRLSAPELLDELLQAKKVDSTELAQWQNLFEKTEGDEDSFYQVSFDGEGRPFFFYEDLLVEEIKRYGPYEVIEELARGGMGIVYKARHPESKQLFAIKVLLSGEDASEQALKRFHREIKAVARLKHPNIVQIVDSGQQGGEHYFVMEFIEGQTLDEWTESRHSIEESLQVIQKSLVALHYAHQQGIIHRDIKPENILINRAGEPKITDFGLAKDHKLNTKSQMLTYNGAVFGTPAYMSPEQVRGEIAKLDAKSDVYSMAVTLYRVLTKECPFSDPVEHLLYSKILNEDPLPPSRLNPEIQKDLDIILLKALEKNRQKRYRTALLFAEDIGRFLNGYPIKARPISPRERFEKWVKRNQHSLAMVGVFCAICCFFLLYHQWSRFREQQKQQNKENVFFQERIQQAQQEIALANQLLSLEKKSQKKKIKFFLNAFGHLNVAISLKPKHLATEQKKFLIGKELLSLAHEAGEHELVDYIASDLEHLTLLSASEKLELHQQLQQIHIERSRKENTADLEKQNEVVLREDFPPIGTQTQERLIPILIQALNSPEEEIQRNALVVLGEFGPKSVAAVPTILELLEGSNPPILEQAIFTLGQIRSSKCIPRLIQCLQSEVLQQKAKEALKNFGEETLPEMIQYLAQEKDPEVRYVLLTLLSEWLEGFRDKAQLLEILQKCLSDDEVKIRHEAAFILVSQGHFLQEILPVLIQMLHQTNASNQIKALKAIGKLGPLAQETTPAVYQLFQEGIFSVQLISAWTLAKIRFPHIPTLADLLQMLSDHDEIVRIFAVQELGQHTESMEVVPALLERIQNDENPLVRYGALTSLVLMNPEAKLVVPSFIRALQDPVSDIRKQAAYALGNLGGEAEEAIPFLIQALAEEEILVSRQVGTALKQIGKEVQEVLPLLIQSLQENPDKNIRQEIPVLLVALGGLEVIPSLRNALKDPHWKVVYQVENALRSFGIEGVRALMLEAELALKESPTTLKYINTQDLFFLLEILEKDNSEMRAIAAKILYLMEPLPEKIWPQIQKGMFDPVPEVRFAILKLFMRFPSHLIRPSLIKMLGDSDPIIRKYVENQFLTFQIEMKEMVALLIQTLGGKNADERELAKSALVYLNIRAIPHLIEAFQNEDPVIQNQVKWLISQLRADAIPELILALKHQNVQIRSHVAWALGEIKAVQAIPFLIEALKDPQEKVRLEIVWALGEIGNTQALSALKKALKDENQHVRSMAALALKKIQAE